MLQLLAYTGLNEDQKDYVQAALQSTKRLTSLLSDILDLSRIEAGKLEIHAAPFDISQQKQAILDVFSFAAKNKGLDLDFRMEPGAPTKLMGDESRLHQILFNLVGNAIKFTEKGRVQIEAMALRHPGLEGLRLLFIISDTGIGISDQQLKQIFEPFVQADGSYARHFQGAGLGLSIVKKLIDLMGGTIAIDNAEGAGTAMYVSLPFKEAGNGQNGSEAWRPGEQIGGETRLRVLVVEDDDMNLTVAVKMLERLGHVASTAKDGPEALRLLSEEEFDLVFMDVQLPDMNGVEVTAAIRNSEALGPKAKMPIVAMTAYAMSGDREKFLAAGMNYYLAKPIDFNELKQLVDSIARKPASSA